MNWLEQIQKENRKVYPRAIAGKPTTVRVLAEIPPTAKPNEVFRIEVEIVRIAERVTKGDDPCYFFACRDEDGLKFSVVVWEAQMFQLTGRVEEGMHVPLDVHVPKPPYTAFTLA